MSTVTQPNPLAEGLHDYRLADPSIMVIFGATGDLSSKKLLPAIYNLAKQRLLPAGFAVMGAAIDDMSDDAFRKHAADAITQHSRTQPIDQTVLHAFMGEAFYQKVDFSKRDDFVERVGKSTLIDSVQLTAAEELGGERRGAYYDRAGALRDIVQTHAVQLRALTAMEPPIAFDANAVRDEKVKVLRAIRPLSEQELAHGTVRGQYSKGWILGERVVGYREEHGIPPGSLTETFAVLRLFVDNWRWAGVPFYIRAGKRLPKRATEIRVAFKKPPHLTFGRDAAAELESNAITLRIQPEEGISPRFVAKVPSAGVKLRSVTMDFDYASSFLVETPEAYERLLLDCMIGDPTLFTRADEVEAAWAFIDPIEAAWRDGRPALQFYEAGTWGTAAAAKLLEADGREWHRP